MLKEITVKNFTLQYELTFKKVKNINIRITPDKRVMVSANRFVSEGAIEEFIVSKIEFITYGATEKLPRNTMPILYEESFLSILRTICNLLMLEWQESCCRV
mgnify:CR=1 FL=1